MSKPKIGFIGLGIMGKSMAKPFTGIFTVLEGLTGVEARTKVARLD